MSRCNADDPSAPPSGDGEGPLVSGDADGGAQIRDVFDQQPVPACGEGNGEEDRMAGPARAQMAGPAAASPKNLETR